ncbi:MAG: regulatory protein RecX [Longimicrobiales bacterium]|nr:regulatory protein RecX [Longimicrobiales bacterium]
MASSPPLITRIQPLRPRGLKVRVHLDRGEPLEVMLEALERHRLGVGDPLPPDRRHHLLNDDADIQVRHAALNLLSYRARTRSELARRLRQKGFRPARIDPCLDRLQEKGLIDDEAVAASFIRDRLRHRPRGKAALSSELRAKGVAREVADRAIQQVFEDEETDDRALARSVAEGWVARQSRDLLDALVSRERPEERTKARRRLVGYLTRRGFRGPPLTDGIDRAVELAGELAGE